MNINEILSICTDDIDYESLSEEMLIELVLADGDQFIATDAIFELQSRNKKSSCYVARKVVDENIGDSYLKAKALNILYEEDFDYFSKFLNNEIKKIDKIILDIIIDFMWCDINIKIDGYDDCLLILAEEIELRGISFFDNYEYVNDIINKSKKIKS